MSDADRVEREDTAYRVGYLAALKDMLIELPVMCEPPAIADMIAQRITDALLHQIKLVSDDVQ